MAKTITIDSVLQAVSVALGTYLGMFLGFTLKQVFEAFQSSSIITAIMHTYGLSKQYGYLNDLIIECSALSNEFLMLLFIVITIFAFFLCLLQFSKPYIGNGNDPFFILLAFVIVAWFFEPLMMIITSIQNPQSIYTIEANIPPSDLATLGYNISQLDRYRWFLRVFLKGFKLVIVVTLLLFSSLASFKIKNFKFLVLRISLMSIPFFASFSLNTFFPVPFPVEYKGGVITGKGFIGWPVPIELDRVNKNIEILAWIFCFTSIFWRELNLLYTRLKSALSPKFSGRIFVR